MGWATVVKLINRLKEADIIESTGTVQRSPGQGKNPEKYQLTNRTPMAIGIDVEYRASNIILLDLRGEILACSTHKTPQDLDDRHLREFLSRSLSEFISQHLPSSKRLAGIGIGLPGIGMSSWMKHNKDYSTDLSAYLEQRLGFRVRIDINVRVYSVYEKWDKQTLSPSDVMFVTIRTGIGSGIFLNGSLFFGHQEQAGEIGHMTVKQGGWLCVCGRRGCLQTEVNQNLLYREYVSKVLGNAEQPDTIPLHDDLLAGLACLFSRARDGQEEALSIVKQAARYLGVCLASCIMILNVSQIVISGHFGTDGGMLLEHVETEIRSRILSRMEFSLFYYPFDEMGFTMGAALLILKDYYTGIPNPGG